MIRIKIKMYIAHVVFPVIIANKYTFAKKICQFTNSFSHILLTFRRTQVIFKPKRQKYKTSNGDVKVDVLLQDKTIWMPQKKNAQLFDVKVPAISKHLNNIYADGELQKKQLFPFWK